jgi:beta-lactamase regulating signal transducer with metallopeptidase domain
MSFHTALSALALPAAIPDWGRLVFLLAVKATLLLGAALVITQLMGRRTAAARHLVWLVTLGALLAMPALMTWAPVSMPVLVNGPSAARAMRSVTHTAMAPAAPHEAVVTNPAAVQPTSLPAIPAATPALMPTTRGLDGSTLAPWIWAIMAIVVLSELAASTFALRRIIRRARPLEARDWRTAIIEIADRLGLEEPPQVLVSDDIAMPFACGVRAPTIVLPAECDTWSPERRQAVLLHELAHVRRRDMLGHLLGRVVCAFYWFHPLVWVAARRLRSESERACDDLAVTCGTRAADYAEHLLEIVVGVRRTRTPALALAMARRSEFEGRMLAILDPELPHAAPSRARTAALVGCLALSAGLIAATKPVPRTTRAPERAVSTLTPLTVQASVPVFVTAKSLSDAQAVQSPRQSNVSRAPAIPEARQGSAARAQATTPDDRPVLLAKILRTDSSAKVRRIAAWGLEEYSESTDGAAALANAVRRDADPTVRETAAWALGSYDGSKDITDALVAALRDANVEVRATAAWSLGSIGADGAADALTAALADSNRDVKRRAAWALGSIGVKHAPPALVAMLRDPDADTRRLAAWALYSIEDPSAVPALESALRAEKDPDLQLDDLRALAAAGDNSIDAIRGLLESPDQRIKTMAVRALAGGHATGPWPWPWPEPRPEAP